MEVVTARVETPTNFGRLNLKSFQVAMKHFLDLSEDEEDELFRSKEVSTASTAMRELYEYANREYQKIGVVVLYEGCRSFNEVRSILERMNMAQRVEKHEVIINVRGNVLYSNSYNVQPSVIWSM